MTRGLSQFSLLVGNNHLGFHRQFAAAGLVDRIPIVSPVFGQAGELTSLGRRLRSADGELTELRMLLSSLHDLARARRSGR